MLTALRALGCGPAGWCGGEDVRDRGDHEPIRLGDWLVVAHHHLEFADRLVVMDQSATAPRGALGRRPSTPTWKYPWGSRPRSPSRDKPWTAMAW